MQHWNMRPKVKIGQRLEGSETAFIDQRSSPEVMPKAYHQAYSLSSRYGFRQSHEDPEKPAQSDAQRPSATPPCILSVATGIGALHLQGTQRAP
jgi:hypothetical protein